MADEASKKSIKISCGNLVGHLYPARFGPAGKSLCIKLNSNKDNDSWLSPIEFEKMSGKGAQHNWKRTLRSVSNDQLANLVEDGTLKMCLKHCECASCQLIKDHSSSSKFYTLIE
jgi:hypothetical protein